MKRSSLEYTGVHGRGSKVTAHLAVIFFEDSGSTVAYCPALDVYGYGSDEQEAKSSFETCLDEYFRYTVNKGTLKADLEGLGWKVTGSNKAVPPKFSTLLETNCDFREIFDSRDFRKVDETVDIPFAFA